MLPSEVTAKVLREFRDTFPTVALRLRVEGLGAVASCLIGEDAQLAIGWPIIDDDPAFERQAIGSIDLIPATVPIHPLASPGIAPGESLKHL